MIRNRCGPSPRRSGYGRAGGAFLHATNLGVTSPNFILGCYNLIARRLARDSQTAATLSQNAALPRFAALALHFATPCDAICDTPCNSKSPRQTNDPMSQWKLLSFQLAIKYAEN
jgi:hypothetical protein